MRPIKRACLAAVSSHSIESLGMSRRLVPDIIPCISSPVAAHFGLARCFDMAEPDNRR